MAYTVDQKNRTINSGFKAMNGLSRFQGATLWADIDRSGTAVHVKIVTA